MLKLSDLGRKRCRFIWKVRKGFGVIQAEGFRGEGGVGNTNAYSPFGEEMGFIRYINDTWNFKKKSMTQIHSLLCEF